MDLGKPYSCFLCLRHCSFGCYSVSTHCPWCCLWVLIAHAFTHANLVKVQCMLLSVCHHGAVVAIVSPSGSAGNPEARSPTKES